MHNGDVIQFDYELWVEGRDQLYDTTLRDAAEQAGILEPNATYQPMHYVVGSGRLIPGLEAALLAATVGTTEEVTIPADKAYGPREAKKIETVAIHEFKKNKVEPEPGIVINYKDRRGLVTTVGGGRVRVDFNPPLAGKSLRYRFTVRGVAKSLPEKVDGIIHMNYPNPFQWQIREETVEEEACATILLPEGVAFDRNWPSAKVRIVLDVRRHLKVPRVRFVEEFRIPDKAATHVESLVAAEGKP